MTWIIDASVAAKWFFPEEDHVTALTVLERDAPLHAPAYLLVELANIAWKKCRQGDLPSDRLSALILQARAAFNRLHEDADWLERALEIAVELDHPVYDCLYLAGAEALGATIITADRHFLRKLSGTKQENRAIFLSDLPPP